jgi:F420-dependent oxidoreductase-like protein
MKIGYHCGYWGAGPPPGAQDAVVAAESLGFDSVWTAEAYGSDALTPLAWWGARTSRVLLGTAVVQMAARTATATAMAAMTLDHLSGGRFVLGLGASGPQVVEGWYGQPFARPLARTREYVAVVRDAVARQAPVTARGEHVRLPLDVAAPGSTGLGKPLLTTLHPLRPDLPIHLAAQGPRNIALAAEIADGWLPLFFTPRLDGRYRELLADGFSLRSAGRRPQAEFEVSATVPVMVADDVATAMDAVRPLLALYIGGMGATGANFHGDVVARLGYAAAVEEIQRRYRDRDRAGAAAAVPTELIDDVALVGPVARIRERLTAWESTCATRLIAWTQPQLLPAVAAALLRNAAGPATEL